MTDLEMLLERATERRRGQGPPFAWVAEQCESSARSLVRIALVDSSSPAPNRCAVAVPTRDGRLVQFLVDLTDDEFNRLPVIEFDELVVVFHKALDQLGYRPAGDSPGSSTDVTGKGA